MAVIKTGSWLSSRLVQSDMSVDELSSRTGLSKDLIYKIIRGDRVGSVSTWSKINEVFPPLKISFECSEIISELREEVELYGSQHPCFVFYYIDSSTLIFCDYALPEEFERFRFHSDLKDKFILETNLASALELFYNQNKVI